MTGDKLNDEIRFRCPSWVKPKLKAIAKLKRTKYQHEAREAVIRFLESEKAAAVARR